MPSEIVLLVHVAFGVLGILSALWAFVELLNLSPGNVVRVRAASLLVAISMLGSAAFGGYWDIQHWQTDQALAHRGPWAFATRFFDVKEHYFFALLAISLYFPLSVYRGDPASTPGTRRLCLCVAGLIVLLGLLMEGIGAIVSAAVRLGMGA